MKIAFVIMAVLAGAILLLEVTTGSVKPLQVAGFGIVMAAMASLVP